MERRWLEEGGESTAAVDRWESQNCVSRATGDVMIASGCATACDGEGLLIASHSFAQVTGVQQSDASGWLMTTFSWSQHGIATHETAATAGMMPVSKRAKAIRIVLRNTIIANQVGSGTIPEGSCSYIMRRRTGAVGFGYVRLLNS